MTSIVRYPEASSSTPPRSAYHVFLSFRGEDTRRTFTDHLYTALDRVGFHTFRDDDGIKRGENIDSELQRAIQESRISIIVFSKDYASSRWCLDELVRILKQKRTSEHQVLPVFYDVDPSDVRKQTGSFEESFLRHERRFKTKGIEERSQWMDKIEEWRAALREIADIAGMDLKNQDGGYESTCIQKIVIVVEEKLKPRILSTGPKLIGLHSRARDINLWLQDGSNDVSMYIISGIGGIGKTTLAKYVYNLNFKRFEGSSFLENISEISMQPKGLVCLQSQLLSDITNYKKEIPSINEGMSWIELALHRKKVLIILDDVDKMDQINVVLEMRERLYDGSKVIITTRDEWSLKVHGAFTMHRVECMNDHESIELFSWHAFGQDHPPKAYVEHTERALKYCGGLPLALELLGSTLAGESVDVWINALEKLEAIPNHPIFKKMRISYDSLLDDHDKNLFLHISCYFVGEDKDIIAKILDGCDFFTTVGIQNLVRRCMLNIEDNKVTMHRLLQDMGREIVRLESPKKPEKRSRLWRQNDSCHVLREKLGTEKIEGLALDMHMSKEDESTRKFIGVNKTKPYQMFSFGFFRPSVDTPYKDSNEVAFETSAFTRMRNLKILQLNYAELKGHYKEFPRGLKWLKWHGFPLKHLPNDFPLESLIALDMRYSNLRKVWKGETKFLGLLKILNLSHSHDLVKTPAFGALPKLERLIMEDCTSLIEIHESIGSLEGLVLMNVEDCINLRKLPKGICMLKLLETFIISGCSNLTQLPEEMKNMESLKVFRADRTALDPKIWAKPKKNLEMSWSWLPRSLVTLSLAYSNLSDDAFPRDFSSIPLLLDLNLNGNPICKLPDCIRSLFKLRELSFESCSKLQSLYRLPSVIRLSICDCTSLERITLAPQASCSGYSMSGNDKLVEFEGDFKLQPIEKVDADIIKNFGICNLETMANAEMNFFRSFLYNTKKLIRLPTQGLFEVGVFSTFIPGRELPIEEWLSNKYSSSPSSWQDRCRVWRAIEPPLSFTVHSRTSIPNHRSRIRCLNVGVVYALTHRQQDWRPPPLTLTISNKTKHLSWSYGPLFFAIPVEEKHLMWLSQWKVGNQFRLEVGDEVIVRLLVDVCFEVKECGINLVYEETKKETLPQLESAHPNCQGVSFPEHCRIGGAYIDTYSHYFKDWISLLDYGKKNLADEERVRRHFGYENLLHRRAGFLPSYRPMKRSPRAQDKKVFPEAAASGNKLDDHFGLPSDDSKDNDYDPHGSELDENVKGDESRSDEYDFYSASEDFGASPNNNQKLELPSDDSDDDFGSRSQGAKGEERK